MASKRRLPMRKIKEILKLKFDANLSYHQIARSVNVSTSTVHDTGGQMVMDITDYCKVNVDQFYGIEIEEFPCQVSVVGMWLIDHQMNTLVSEHFGLYFARLPLEKSATIVLGNALRIDWEKVIPKNQLRTHAKITSSFCVVNKLSFCSLVL